MNRTKANDELHLEAFDSEHFNVDNYVKRITATNVYTSNIADFKDQLTRSAQLTAEEIKHSVYCNYGNFMETAREVGHLEGKMSALRQSLDEQRTLLNMFKNISLSSSSITQPSNASTEQQPNLVGQLSSSTSSLGMLLEQVEGCFGLITQKPGRTLLYHSDLEALHMDDFSVSYKLHAYLLSDALLLALPQRKRKNTSIVNSNKSTKESNKAPGYLYKFQALYELQDIKIMSIDDTKEVRNAFQVLKFPESLAFRCANVHIKKEWLDNVDRAKKVLERELDQNDYNSGTRRRMFGSMARSNSSKNIIIEEDDESVQQPHHQRRLSLSSQDQVRLLREQFSDFDIYLAQRDFEKGVDLLIKLKQSTGGLVPANNNNNNNTTTSQTTSKKVVASVMTPAQQVDTGIFQLIYSQKEQELIAVLRKDLIQAKERGTSKGVLTTGKRVVHSLIRLGIFDLAIDLFIDYHKYLNAETLRKIKLEESNSVYMNNVLNLYFDNLRSSYLAFREAFVSILNDAYSSFISWCDTEIEILIKKLQSQHYLGSQFHLTVENCELIFAKAQEFSNHKKGFEVLFLFETKLRVIIETAIKEQKDILMDASAQRAKLEQQHYLGNNENNTEQLNRQMLVERFLNDLTAIKRRYGDSTQLFDTLMSDDKLQQCTASAVQFSRGLLNYFCDLMRIHYADVNYAMIEAVCDMFKMELKWYEKAMKHAVGRRQLIYNNVLFIFECVLPVVEKLHFDKTKVNAKLLVKVREKYIKFKQDYFKL